MSFLWGDVDETYQEPGWIWLRADSPQCWGGGGPNNQGALTVEGGNLRQPKFHLVKKFHLVSLLVLKRIHHCWTHFLIFSGLQQMDVWDHAPWDSMLGPMAGCTDLPKKGSLMVQFSQKLDCLGGFSKWKRQSGSQEFKLRLPVSRAPPASGRRRMCTCCLPR